MGANLRIEGRAAPRQPVALEATPSQLVVEPQRIEGTAAG
jgi:hypothetical protein